MKIRFLLLIIIPLVILQSCDTFLPVPDAEKLVIDIPINPSPANNSQLEITRQEYTLEWDDDSKYNQVNYDFYIGTTPEDLILTEFNLYYPNATVELKKGYTYYWQVVAKLEDVIEKSAIWSFKTDPMEAPSNYSPENNEIVDLSSPSLYFSWSTDYTNQYFDISYTIYLGESLDDMEFKVNTLNNSAYIDLKMGKTYYWKVVAKQDEISKVESEIWSFSTEPLQAPSLYNPYSYNTNTKTTWLNWNQPYDSSFDILYDLYLGESEDQLILIATDLTDDDATIVIDANKTYYWRVDAKLDGDVAQSEIRNFIFY